MIPTRAQQHPDSTIIPLNEPLIIHFHNTNLLTSRRFQHQTKAIRSHSRLLANKNIRSQFPGRTAFPPIMSRVSKIEPTSSYPPETTADELNHLAHIIKDWSIGNGLAVRTPPTVIASEADPTGITAVPAPVTLFPSGFPRQAFLQGQKAQQAYNDLYAAVSRDEKFLADVVKQ